MAIPVIYPTISVLCFRQGQYFEFQPAATNSPTSWAAVGLPDDMTINAETGLIAGTSMGIGVYDVTLTATNGDGISAEFFFPIVLLESGGVLDEAIELDVDLDTGAVTRFNSSESKPVFYAKSGDRLLISIGFKKQTYYQTVLMREIKFALKEYEPERLILLSEGDYILSRSGLRYLILVDFSKVKMRASLSNNEADKGTAYKAICELQWSWDRDGFGVGEIVTLSRASQTFEVHAERRIAR